MAEWTVLLVPALGRALLHFLWQGALIGLLAALALQALRDARPQLRYAVACLALLACVLAPLAALLLDLAATSTALPQVADQARPFGAPQTLLLRAWPDTFGGMDFETAVPWIVAAWAAGAGALSLRMTLGVLWIHRLRNSPQDATQALWQGRLDALAARFGLRAIALRVVESLDSPASAGWLRPVVLLPAALLTRMPVDLIEALLAHELAHIRRHDYLVNLLQGAAEALLFYHPATWWLSRRIRIERELIADQLAVQATGEPRRLALALSQLSDIRQSPCPAFHLAQAAHGGHLMKRIEQLVRPARTRSGGRLAFPLLGLTAACIAFYAHAQIGQPSRVSPAAPTVPYWDARVVAQATPKASPKARTHTTKLTIGKRSRDAFALVRKDKDGITMSGSTDDISAIKAVKARMPSDFVWFRRDSKAYVVTDPGIVARAQAAWVKTEKHQEEMEALGEQMEVHGARMEKIGEQMEAVSDGNDESPAMQAAAERMEELGERQQALADEQEELADSMEDADDAERAQISRKMDALSGQMDALSREMDEQSKVVDAESRRMDQRLKPLDALSKQMDEASKPMEALGARMDVLGKEHEKLVAQAEREMDQLLQEAIRKGLANPAPGAGKAQ